MSAEMDKQTQNIKKVVSEVPEGGWGYAICVSATLVFTLTTAFLGCFGILYEELINKLELKSATAVLITGVNAMCVAFAGFLTSPLLKLMSFRRLALLACVIHNAGYFGVVFANSFITFFICQSLLQGAGMGILFNLTVSIINEYFLKKRLFATGLIQTSTATLSMGIPVLVTILYNCYGYHGLLMIVSALNMHLFIAVALMQPVEWHLKRVVSPEPERVVSPEPERVVSPEPEGEIKSLLALDNDVDGIPIVKMIDIESLSAATHKNISDDIEELHTTTQKEDSALMKVVKSTFDIYLLKSFLPSYSCLGIGIAIYADYVTTILLPQTLYAANWSQEDTAFAMSLMNFGDLTSRVLLIFGSNHIKIKSMELHMIGVAIGILSRIGLLLTKNGTAVLVLLYVLGTGRSFVITILPLIVSDSVPIEKFTAAMGIFMLFTGICNLSLGMAAGAVRDLTGSYDTTIWISLIILIFTIMQGLIETFYLKPKKAEKQVIN